MWAQRPALGLAELPLKDGHSTPAPGLTEPPLTVGHSDPAPGLEPVSEATRLPCGVQSGARCRAGSGDASPDSGYYGHSE